MRIRVVHLPQQTADMMSGAPFLMLVDRMGDDLPSREVIEQIRTQTGARAVLVHQDDIEFEEIGGSAMSLVEALADATDDLDDDPRSEVEH